MFNTHTQNANWSYIAGWSLSIFVARLACTPAIFDCLSLLGYVRCWSLWSPLGAVFYGYADKIMLWWKQVISCCHGNRWYHIVVETDDILLSWKQMISCFGLGVCRTSWSNFSWILLMMRTSRVKYVVQYTLVLYIVWFMIVSFMQGCDVFTKGTAIFKFLRLSAILLIDIFFHIYIWAPYRYLSYRWFKEPWPW
jgi:hypothetical protein